MTSFSLAFWFFVQAKAAQAQNAVDFGKLKSKGIPSFKFPIDEGVLGFIIHEALRYIFVIAGLALLLYLLYGGFQLMTSRGDPGGVKEAQAKITSAIVGFVIIFVAYWLVQAVGVIFGIDAIKNIFTF